MGIVPILKTDASSGIFTTIAEIRMTGTFANMTYAGIPVRRLFHLSMYSIADPETAPLLRFNHKIGEIETSTTVNNDTVGAAVTIAGASQMYAGDNVVQAGARVTEVYFGKISDAHPLNAIFQAGLSRATPDTNTSWGGATWNQTTPEPLETIQIFANDFFTNDTITLLEGHI